MSGYIIEEFWHLGNYQYVFYRFVLEQLLRKEQKEPSLMLDAGCGRRISSLSHVSKNLSVIGVDISRENIAESNRKKKEKGFRNIDFIVASITFLPFRDLTFDLIVSVDVLEHIPNNREAIAEISRICKPEAKFVGSTTNLLNPFLMFDSFAPKKIMKIFADRFAGSPYERHSRFSFSRLMRTIECSNFQVCDIKLIGFPFFQPWL